MTRNDLLEVLKVFTQETVSGMSLPTQIQSENEQQEYREPEVYKMRLPDGRAAKKKAPYILHQVITGMDTQPDGKPPESRTTIRTIFCVYSPDEQEGGLMLLELMERLRIALLRKVVLDGRFQLDLGEGLETLAYPDDTAPFFCGEMKSVWRMPEVEREVRPWL